MKFSCSSKVLKKGLNHVEKAIPKQSSLAVLQNVSLDLKEGKLTLRGNDLELGIESHVAVPDSAVNGAILVKAKTLNEVISKLPQQDLNLKVSENKSLQISAGSVEFNLLGEDSDNYPAFPTVDTGTTFKIKISDLLALIKYTILAVSFDDTKKFFNGILISIKDNKLSFTATDGFRLALKSQACPELQNAADIAVIIPFKAISEVHRLLSNFDSDQAVNFSISKTQISFSSASFLLISRLITGQFPDTNKVIPTDFSHQLKVSRRDLLHSFERAAIIAAASNDIVKFNFTEKQISLESKASALGDFKESVSVAVIKGSEATAISFNVKLILDFLRAVEDDDVIISFNNAVSPCQFSVSSDPNYTYIVMPIRTPDF
eukprot:COSAG01_NODE_9_length_43729_cov_66.133463_38_plen_376_part_00